MSPSFQLVYWRGRLHHAVQIAHDTRPRDLPHWFAPCFDTKRAGMLSSGGLEPLRYRNGTFFHVAWRQPSPLESHTAIETQLNPGDWLVAQPSGGVAAVRGQYALDRQEEELP